MRVIVVVVLGYPREEDVQISTIAVQACSTESPVGAVVEFKLTR